MGPRMRRRETRRALPGVVIALCLGVRAAFAQGAEDAPRPPPKTYFTTAIVRGDVGMRVIDYWSRGPHMRARTMMSGHAVTTIVFDERYVVYDELTGKGIDIGRSPRALADDADRVRPFAFELEEIQAAGGERIEELVFGSRKGEIWQVTDARGKRKVWVTVGTPQVPLRAEAFERAAGAKVDIDYQNWVFDLDLPDRFFAPPAKIEFERYDYETYMKKSLEGPVGVVPVLYPDLLHGKPPI